MLIYFNFFSKFLNFAHSTDKSYLYLHANMYIHPNLTINMQGFLKDGMMCDVDTANKFDNF